MMTFNSGLVIAVFLLRFVVFDLFKLVAVANQQRPEMKAPMGKTRDGHSDLWN